MAAAVAAASWYRLAGLPVPVINPLQARDFARGMGYVAKTYAIDAVALAHFAEATGVVPRPLPDEAARELDAPLDRRRQLVAMRVMEKNRRATAAGGGSAATWTTTSAGSMSTRLAFARADRELDERIRSSPAWREKDDLLRGAGDRAGAAADAAGGLASRHWAGGVEQPRRAAAARGAGPEWPTTAVSARARGGSWAAGGRCAPCCIWRRWRRGGTTRRSRRWPTG